MQSIIAVVGDESRKRMGRLKWGLVPPWADDEKIGARMINARAETAAEKPAFREAYRRKRCLIPADGYYEWKTTEDGKQPYRITVRGGGLFSMAGLYETWTAADGRKVHTCAILTTEANDRLAAIHDRMPVILHREDEALWLDRTVQEREQLDPLLVSYPSEEMEAYEVDKRVGSVKHDDPGLIKRV